MKKTLLLFFGLLVFTAGFAVNPPANNTEGNCHCGLGQVVQFYLDDHPGKNLMLVKLKLLPDTVVRQVAYKLCANILMATIGGFRVDKFKNIILEAEGVSPTASEHYKDAVVSAFLIKYNQQMICPRNTSDSDSRDLHLYKIAILNGVIELYDEILLDPDDYQVDFNAYEMVDGKKETVVDYINKLMATGGRDNERLEMLRDDIIGFGGKSGEDLK